MGEALHSATDLLALIASGGISPEDFEQALWALSKGHRREARKYESGVRLYRTRIWPKLDRPMSVAELSYPKHAVRLNRANLEGEPVFYGSAGLPPSFVECRLEKGLHVICSEWFNACDMALQEIGLSSDESSDVERVYREVFTSTDPKMYSCSARIARHLLSEDSVSGLLYPSIAAQNGSHNVALKARFVDAGLQLVNASLYYVKDVTPSLQYQIAEIDFALPSGESSLSWMGRRRQWVLRNQGGLKFVSTGWSWDVCDMTGALVDPE